MSKIGILGFLVVILGVFFACDSRDRMVIQATYNEVQVAESEIKTEVTEIPPVEGKTVADLPLYDEEQYTPDEYFIVRLIDNDTAIMITVVSQTSEYGIMPKAEGQWRRFR